jgi:hypothetical protein
MQVSMQNSVSGPLEMDSATTGQDAEFSLYRHRDMDSTTVSRHAEFSLWTSRPLNMASTSKGQDAGYSLWTSGHGFHHYRSACRIQPLDLWTWISALQVSMQNSVSGPLDMDFNTAGQDAEFSLWTS